MNDYDSAILNKDLILVDGSANTENNFTWNLYEIKKANRLDIDEIAKASRAIENLNELLLKPNTYTIPEVRVELNDFNRIISDKIIYFNTGLQNANNGKSKGQIKQIMPSRKERINELEKLQEEIYNTLKITRTIQYFINTYSFKKLFEISTFLTRIEPLKQVSHGWEKNKTNKDTLADEKLVAIATYKGLIDGEKITVVTRDNDLNRIYFRLSGLLRSNEFASIEAGKSRDRSSREQVHIYNPKNQSIALNPLTVEEICNLRGRKNNNLLRQMIHEFWQAVKRERKLNEKITKKELSLTDMIESI